MLAAQEILQHYSPLITNQEEENYLNVHSERFSRLIKFILKEVKLHESLKVMDIGPSFFTDILSKNLPEAEIYTMGFTHPESRGGHLPEFIEIDESKFYQFDLNTTDHVKSWATPPPMDVVVMGEVLEHLYTSPVHVLSFIKSFLKPGGLFILGTPNAVALEKRVKLLFGRNPYELIRLNKDNPGHFREYTIQELREIGEESGLRLKGYEIRNYFTRYTSKGKLFDSITNICPESFRTGINAVYTRD